MSINRYSRSERGILVEVNDIVGCLPVLEPERFEPSGRH